jgi:hypothetical protein
MLVLSLLMPYVEQSFLKSGGKFFNVIRHLVYAPESGKAKKRGQGVSTRPRWD